MKKKRGGIIFLLVTLITYIILLFFNRGIALDALGYFSHIFVRVFYVLLIVFLFMFFINLFLKPKTVLKYLGKGSGMRGWIIAIISGIISMGSIYLWYPLLKELREKGMKKGLIATFLYNRAVKVPLLPIMIYYFGWLFALFLTIYMVIFSVFMGIIMDRIS